MSGAASGRVGEADTPEVSARALRRFRGLTPEAAEREAEWFRRQRDTQKNAKARRALEFQWAWRVMELDRRLSRAGAQPLLEGLEV
jgi:hypothetical protein